MRELLLMQEAHRYRPSRRTREGCLMKTTHMECVAQELAQTCECLGNICLKTSPLTWYWKGGSGGIWDGRAEFLNNNRRWAFLPFLGLVCLVLSIRVIPIIWQLVLGMSRGIGYRGMCLDTNIQLFQLGVRCATRLACKALLAWSLQHEQEEDYTLAWFETLFVKRSLLQVP